MIDARNYKTTEELAEAMQFEHDISEKEWLNKKISELETAIKIIKSRYFDEIRILLSKRANVQRSIDKYWEKQRQKDIPTVDKGDIVATKTHTVAIRSKCCRYSISDTEIVTIEDPFDLLLEVDGRTFKFNLVTDDDGQTKLGLLLINGVDCKITAPPAFSYPGPYILLG